MTIYFRPFWGFFGANWGKWKLFAGLSFYECVQIGSVVWSRKVSKNLETKILRESNMSRICLETSNGALALKRCMRGDVADVITVSNFTSIGSWVSEL